MAEGSKKPETKASKFKRLRALLIDYVKTPELKEGEPKPDLLFGLSPFQRIRSDIDYEHESPESLKRIFKEMNEEARSDELLAIARADLKLAKETNQKNLIILHRTQLVSIAALVVAIFALVVHR